MNETRELARFVSELRYEDLPGEVIEKAKDLILDSLGVQLAASTKPWSKTVYKYVKGRLCGLAESTIVNYGDKTTATDAAFANASFGHGFEYDDTHRESHTHLSCVIVPSALALGESHLATGKAFILAVVLGCDVMARVGLSINPTIYKTGHRFHPTPVAGAIGSAAVASKILGLDAETTMHALSISGSHSAGLYEFDVAGGSVKRMHAGIAAEGGLRATLLARDGLTGPPTALEGQYGLCRLFSDGVNYDLDALTANLGKEFKIMEIAYKRYCQSYCQHTQAEAMLKIVNSQHIEPADVEEIKVYTDRHCCILKDPQEVTGAQFSAYFGVALALVKRGCGFRDYTEENLWDPTIRAITSTVTVIEDPSMEVGHGQRPAKVVVRLKDGTTYQERVDFAKGSPENPMSKEELEEKFISLATVVLPMERANQLITTVRGLDSLQDVSRLAALLKA